MQQSLQTLREFNYGVSYVGTTYESSVINNVDFAEYGVERCVPLSNLKSEEILGRIQELVSQK